MVSNQVNASAADRILDRTYPGYQVEKHSLQSQAAGQYAGSQASAPLVQISVNDDVSTRAAAAANVVANTFISRIRTIESSRFAADERSLNHQLDIARRNANLSGYQTTYQNLLLQVAQFRVLRDAQLNSVNVYAPATPPTQAIGPHPTRVGGLAGIIALVLLGSVLLLYDYLRDQPQTEDEVAEIVGAPVLGTVPRFRSKGKGASLVAGRQVQSPAAEAYRLIRTNIRFTNVDNPPGTLVVTSSFPREGKTTTAGNLAHVMAAGGQRVILVDGDLRRPAVHELFEVDRRRVDHYHIGFGLQVLQHLLHPL
jgi:capsular polysaccharide biosynthesis protein